MIHLRAAKPTPTTAPPTSPADAASREAVKLPLPRLKTQQVAPIRRSSNAATDIHSTTRRQGEAVVGAQRCSCHQARS
ncbi:hypothetical protein ABTZ99_28955 [Actinosynnema sp. NPDC002837]